MHHHSFTFVRLHDSHLTPTRCLFHIGHYHTSLVQQHMAVQTSIVHYANPSLSFADIGKTLGISKQAVAKRIELGTAFFLSFGQPIEFPESKELTALREEVARLKALVKLLQIQLVVYAALHFILKCFEEAVHRYFPNFKLRRFSATQKKRLIDYWLK
jgi:predicted DNA-binding protein YlxM (UPF0122 family)